MIAYLVYGLNNKLISPPEPYLKKHNIWESIGYWRHLITINILFDEKEYPVTANKSKNEEYGFIISEKTYKTKLEFINHGEIDITVDNVKYFANIFKGENSKTKVTINNKDFHFVRNDILSEDITASDDGTSSVDEVNSFISPLPGRVFKINVKNGDEVKKMMLL